MAQTKKKSKPAKKKKTAKTISKGRVCVSIR